MVTKFGRSRAASAVLALFGILSASLGTAAQDLVAMNGLGSSSVFVFRTVKAQAKRVFAKPTRTKAQQLETAAKIKKQYVTLAKAKPDPNRSKIIDPTKLGPKGGHDVPPAQASKLFTGVGEYYVDKGEYDTSFDFFRDAIRLDGKNAAAKLGYSDALALKGNDLLAKDQSDAAKKLFLEAITNNPKNSAAYFGLGEIYSDSDNPTEAIKSYEQSLQNDKGLTEIYVPLGILYYQAGDVAKADDLLTKALAAAPNSSETQYLLGLVRQSQSKTDEALAAFKKSSELDPAYADAYLWTGEMLMRKKMAAEAAVEFKKAGELKANYYDAIVGLGQAYYESGNYPAAIEQFTKATKMKNTDWAPYAGLADAQRASDDFRDAVGNYKLATDFLLRQPNYNKDAAADLYSKFGLSIGRQCQINMAKGVNCNLFPWASAITNMQKAADLGNSDIDYANLGWAYYNAARNDLDMRDTAGGQAKLELAKTNLLKATQGNPVVAEGAYQNLGGVLIDQGDFKGAVDALNKVVDKHPEWSFSRYALGTAYFKLNDYDNAAKWFKAVVDAEPTFVPALASLGYAQIKLKKGGEVKKTIEKMKKLDPNEALKLERDMKAAKL